MANYKNQLSSIRRPEPGATYQVVYEQVVAIAKADFLLFLCL